MEKIIPSAHANTKFYIVLVVALVALVVGIAGLVVGLRRPSTDMPHAVQGMNGGAYQKVPDSSGATTKDGVTEYKSN